MLDGTGMSHGVLIQVSVHGTDNRLMLDTLQANRQRLRGIAVAPLGLPDGAYRGMQEAGVVGLRLNVLYGGGIGFDKLADYGALCRELGWHLQFLLDARELPALARPISKLQVPFVVDHMGHFPAELGVKEPGFQTLLSLMRDGGWVKLSGAFRVTSAGTPYHEYDSDRAGTLRRRARPLCLGFRLAACRQLEAHAQRRRTPRSHGRLGAG